tara:strand:+ start:1261 stop:1662 length:402 start_codon:yes stop_codon:yes gene_type:complete
MTTYRKEQAANGNWLVYKREDFGSEEVIATAQTEKLANILVERLEPPEPDEKVGGKYYTWKTEDCCAGYFETIDEAIEDFKEYESMNMTFSCPEFDHVEVTEMDGGMVGSTVSTISWEQKARILDRAIQEMRS